VRRETGKEQVVKVHRNEGVAIHIGPKPCVTIREGVGEASVGERAGQPLSRESIIPQGADAVQMAEGNTERRASASASSSPAWSQTLACTHAPCAGTGRSPGWSLQDARKGPHREGEEP